MLVLISFREWLHSYNHQESEEAKRRTTVLISFREWLHSYRWRLKPTLVLKRYGSHLFQRVASFLHIQEQHGGLGHWPNVLISFREWLHSYLIHGVFDRLGLLWSSHLFQRVASFLLGTFADQLDDIQLQVLISFREWLHSYDRGFPCRIFNGIECSHLFQRVASFLHQEELHRYCSCNRGFSSLSESGFIPTLRPESGVIEVTRKFSSLSESGFIPT